MKYALEIKDEAREEINKQVLNPRASSGLYFRSKLRGILPSLLVRRSGA